MTHNGRTLSDCLPLTDPQEDADRLYSFLKHGAEGSPGDTEESTVGTQPDHYPKPVDREEGNIDALWGESDIKDGDPAGTAQHHSNAVLGEFRRGREEFLGRMFANYSNSKGANNGILKKQLGHAARGDYEASKPMPLDGSKRQPPETPTLLSKTKNLLDR